ncbi:hypothetical protein [Marinobacter sp.]|uniref:hypothetical protein n=1 Tax=Marinobacter sp. TaxID=50741 RepID=UPI003A90BAFF
MTDYDAHHRRSPDHYLRALHGWLAVADLVYRQPSVQPVIAAIAMSLSSLCVLLNSLRMQRHVAGDAPDKAHAVSHVTSPA